MYSGAVSHRDRLGGNIQSAQRFGPQQLLARARAGTAVDYSPLAAQPFLLVDYRPELAAADTDELAAWLRRYACPVIAIAAQGDGDRLIDACDLRISDAVQLTPLLRSICANPTAATVLVQVLRVTECLPLEDALCVESLAYASLQGGAEYQTWLAQYRAHKPVRADDGPAVVLARDGDSVTLELNRACNRNAMSVEMRDALVEALQMVLLDDSIQELRLSGRGRCFSTGGDLTEFGTLPDVATGHIVRSVCLPGRLLARCASRAKVTLHGACIGSGIEFPAFAGHIAANKNTHFQLPEIGMGLIPGAGGCISIARRMGRQRTAWLALSGKRMRAAQALEWGLIDEIVD